MSCFIHYYWRSYGILKYFRYCFVGYYASFLMNRTMSVIVEGGLSDSRAVTGGVLHGSVLGPVLFLIYINFVTGNSACSFKAFADDYKLYLK